MTKTVAKPDYDTPCENCGQTPTVELFDADNPEVSVYHTGMCGPCTWGEADTIDPSNW